ncbi:MAG: [Fe-Fe] hydrogenase large subunit C-terminal domain-containing protein [Slackia sp.]
MHLLLAMRLGVLEGAGPLCVGACGFRSRSRVDAVAKDDCSYCGQCITHCPVGALHERSDVSRVFDAIDDPETITIAQIAPSVRTSWHEGLDLAEDKASVGRMAAAVKSLGFDYVFDTDFAADVTIMEEGSELLDRLGKGGEGPMFTSCCPGWVRFLKARYPELVSKLSTTKSPQQIFGALVKTYYAKLLDVDPSRLSSCRTCLVSPRRRNAHIGHGRRRNRLRR